MVGGSREAQPHIGTVGGQGHESTGYWLRLAKEAADANSRDRVSAHARRALLLQPVDREAIRFFRDYVDWSGNAVELEKWITRELRVDPSDAETWFAFGRQFERRNRGDLAFGCYRKSAILAPAHERVLLHLSQTLCFIAQRRGAGAALWRAPAIVAARDAVIWSQLASIEFAIRGEMTFLSKMLEVAAAELRADPAICRVMAFQAMRRGALDDARDLMVKAFQRFRDVGPAGAGRGGDYLEYLRMLVWSGRFDVASDLLGRTGVVSGPLALSYFVLHQVSRLAATKAPRGQETGKERLIISVPVWGRAHTELWQQCGLHAFLDEESLPLFNNRLVEVQIFTTSDNWAFLNEAPGIAELRKRAEVTFFDLQSLLGSDVRDRNYLAMIVAHWTSLVLGRRDQSDVIVLVADYLFGRGSLGYLGRQIASKSYDAMYSVDLPTGERAWQNLNDLSAFPEGPGRAPKSDLVSLFLANLSHRVSAYAVGEELGSVPSDPSRLNVIGKAGVEIRTMQPQLLYASAGLLQKFLPLSFGATDNGFADMALSSGVGLDRMLVLNDLEEFVCSTIEFDEEARVASAYFPKRIATDRPVEELTAQVQRSKFLTPARAWALRQPVCVGQTPGEESLLGLLADQLQRFPDDLDALFCRHVVLPAFLDVWSEERN